MTENTNANSALTYSEVIRAVERLTEEEKQIILNMTNIEQLSLLMTSKEAVDDYKKLLEEHIRTCHVAIGAMSKLYEYVNNLTNDTDFIVGNYEKLTDAQKKEIALRLLNNNVFQKDCCNILVSDVEKIIKENPTLKAINDTFNIVGFYKKNIERGIGMNHKYEV